MSKKFSCEYCNKLLASQHNLKLHLRRHTGENPYSCAECGKSFASKSRVKAHSVIHARERPYSCKHCGFASKYRLDAHEKLHMKEKLNSCDLSSRKRSLRGCLRYHSSERPHSSNLCGRTSPTSSVLNSQDKSHGYLHLESEPCENCRVQPAGPDRDIGIHEEEKPFCCSASSLNVHPAIHSEGESLEGGTKLGDAKEVSADKETHAEEKIFTCKYCTESFPDFADLKYHYESDHPYDEFYSCESCEEAFFEKTSLYEHIKSHAKIPPHVCDYCKRGFFSVAGLNWHLKSHVAPQETVNETFSPREPGETNRKSVKRQGKCRRQLKKKLHICLYCGKTLSNEHSLKRHYRFHTNEKPFSCDFCEEAFTTYLLFKKHLDMHDGKRACVCDYCKGKFSTFDALEEHWRVCEKKRTLQLFKLFRGKL